MILRAYYKNGCQPENVKIISLNEAEDLVLVEFDLELNDIDDYKTLSKAQNIHPGGWWNSSQRNTMIGIFEKAIGCLKYSQDVSINISDSQFGANIVIPEEFSITIKTLEG